MMYRKQYFIYPCFIAMSKTFKPGKHFSHTLIGTYVSLLTLGELVLVKLYVKVNEYLTVWVTNTSVLTATTFPFAYFKQMAT